MDPTVRIYFDGGSGGVANVLTLDDPIKGQLDTALYPLADDFANVSADVRAVRIRRGRSDETTNVDASTATVTLDNRTRLYDPTASASVSPYAASIKPRKQITIDIGETPLFTGQVEDWDLSYALGGDSVTLAKASDGFTLLTQAVLASGAGLSGMSGSVIYQTASVAGWPPGRVEIDEGTASVGAHTIDQNQKVLPYLQKIADTEQALLFVGKDGTLTYRDRIAPRRKMGTIFADDGTGIPFQNIEISYGTEFLYTQITVDFPGGSASAVSASANVAAYGLTNYDLDTYLPNGTDAGVIAAFLANRYGEPTFRILGVDVQLNGLTPAQKGQILDLELSNGVTVIFTPNGVGEAIVRDLAVDSIEHNITPGSHIVRFTFFEPFLVHYSGSVTGSSSNTGSVTGTVGYFGTAAGSSSTSGSATGSPQLAGSITGTQGTSGFVLGGEGNVGRVLGSSSTTGTVVGTKTEFGFFTLDTSLLDGGSVLQ